MPGLAEADPLTHVGALELDRLPEHLIVIGGGYVGLELSQAMRRLGSRVTVIERNLRLVHREDEDFSTALHELFKDEGIDIITNARINRVEGKSGQSVKLHLNRQGTEIVLEGSHILAATGHAHPIPVALASMWPACNSPNAGPSQSTNAWTPPRPGFGRLAIVPAARTLPIFQKMIFKSCVTISLAASVTTGRQVSFLHVY